MHGIFFSPVGPTPGRGFHGGENSTLGFQVQRPGVLREEIRWRANQGFYTGCQSLHLDGLQTTPPTRRNRDRDDRPSDNYNTAD